nr:receptor-like kinase [Tanacetum cinerariifolium]
MSNSEISHRKTSLCFLLLLSLISTQFISGLSDDSKSPNETKSDVHSSSRRMSGSTLLIIAIAVAAVVGLSFVLFRLWQKKKREEQYARLLKLFEEDDELELELGLRD